MTAINIPPLAEGEIYAGCIGDTAGNLTHIIILPGDNAPAPWKTQMKWAASIGGDLPTRLELALIWHNCRDQFEKSWYWSNESSEAGWAWFQYFGNGTQFDLRQVTQLRARAVRRLPI